MPMQFIVNQMTGNAPVTYFPQKRFRRQERSTGSQGKRIPDSTLRKALRMRKRGMAWDAIGLELGHSGHGLSGALKRMGDL